MRADQREGDGAERLGACAVGDGVGVADTLERPCAERAQRVIARSGLNPNDRVTGRILQEVLVRSWRDLKSQPDFVASLPRPGGDGTLKRRFREEPSVSLRAKTGTMGEPMASGIAGYFQHPRLGPIAFVILMNKSHVQTRAAKEGSGGDDQEWTLPRMQELQERWIHEYLH